MSIRGPFILVILIAIGVAAAVLLVLMLGRERGRMLRRVGVVGLLAIFQLSGVLTAAVAANDAFNFYPDWTSLLGATHGSRTLPPAPATLNQTALDALATQPPGQGVLIPDVIHDPLSRLSTQASIYIPAAYATAGPSTTFSVVELIHGYPGSIANWTNTLSIRQTLDTEISTGRMPPVIAVIPNAIPTPPRDTECEDVPGGPQVETLLTVDLRTTILRQLRATPSRQAWAAIGYSTGAYCAVMFAFHHHDLYASAASMSGYFTALRDLTTGDLYKSAARREYDSPSWYAPHHPEVRDVALLLGLGGAEPESRTEATHFAGVTPAGEHVQVAALRTGGHSFRMWRLLLPKCLDWLGTHVLAPQVPLTDTVPLAPVFPSPSPTWPHPGRPIGHN